MTETAGVGYVHFGAFDGLIGTFDLPSWCPAGDTIVTSLRGIHAFTSVGAA
jgi:hypothetical protein